MLGRKASLVAALLVGVAHAGCSGTIFDAPREGPSGTGPGPGGGTGTRDPALCATATPTLGATPLRRLTREQYRNTVTDLLGIAALPDTVERRLVELQDGREGGFTSSTDVPSTEVLRTYLSMADDLAATIVASHLPAWIDCSITAADAATASACARQMIEQFGRRAFRRPLSTAADDDEVAHYVALYDSQRSALGANGAMEVVLSAMLASPKFLYLGEPVVADRVDGERVAIDPYAVATRLSYFLWRSTPDDVLLAAAESGALDTPEGVEAEVRRMLDDSRASRSMHSFHDQWLQLEELESVAPDDPIWTDALRAAMRAEPLAFVDEVLSHGDGRLATLLAASFTIATPELAALYGAGAPDASGRVELDPAVRAGLLTQAGFLTQFGTVYPEVHRGLWVRGNLLCDPPPPPPPNIVPQGATYRLSTFPCSDCHQRMDLIGFGFADYDALGRFRPRDAATLASDPPSEVRSPDGALAADVTGPFSSPRELADKLATSPQVHDCVAVQWFRFATGRRDSDQDFCGVNALQEQFRTSGGDIRALAVAIATSEEFRSRSTADLTAE